MELIPWNSIVKISGIPDTIQQLNYTMEFHDKSMEFHGFNSWNSMDLIHGIPWNSTVLPWNSMQFRGNTVELH